MSNPVGECRIFPNRERGKRKGNKTARRGEVLKSENSNTGEVVEWRVESGETVKRRGNRMGGSGHVSAVLFLFLSCKDERYCRSAYIPLYSLLL